MNEYDKNNGKIISLSPVLTKKNLNSRTVKEIDVIHINVKIIRFLLTNT